MKVIPVNTTKKRGQSFGAVLDENKGFDLIKKAVSMVLDKEQNDIFLKEFGKLPDKIKNTKFKGQEILINAKPQGNRSEEITLFFPEKTALFEISAKPLNSSEKFGKSYFRPAKVNFSDSGKLYFSVHGFDKGGGKELAKGLEYNIMKSIKNIGRSSKGLLGDLLSSIYKPSR